MKTRTGTRGRCRHCGREGLSLKARGLCASCWADPAARARYGPRRVLRPFTAADRAYVRASWGRVPLREMARHLGRKVHDVYAAGRRWGCPKLRRPGLAARESHLRQLHGRGWSDREIARHLGLHSSTVSRWLRRLGLPSACRTAPTGGHSERSAGKIRRALAERLAADGLASLRDYRSAGDGPGGGGVGGPLAATPLEARLLGRLHAGGPQTGRQVMAALGLSGSWPLQVLRSLARRGLVERRGKAGRTGGPGACRVYALAAGVAPAVPQGKGKGTASPRTVREPPAHRVAMG